MKKELPGTMPPQGVFFSPELPFNVYRQLIKTDTENKIAARQFARNGYARSLGCGICVDECPQDVLAIEGGVVTIENEEACIACGDCVEECPMGVITEIVED